MGGGEEEKGGAADTAGGTCSPWAGQLRQTDRQTHRQADRLNQITRTAAAASLHSILWLGRSQPLEWEGGRVYSMNMVEVLVRELAKEIARSFDLRSLYPIMNATIDRYSPRGSAYALIWVRCCCTWSVPSVSLQTSARVTRPARPCCPWRGVAGWQPTAGGREGRGHALLWLVLCMGPRRGEERTL